VDVGDGVGVGKGVAVGFGARVEKEAGVSTVTGAAADEQADSNNRISPGTKEILILSKRLIPPLLNWTP
jgi:hypothetical protein